MGWILLKEKKGFLDFTLHVGGEIREETPELPRRAGFHLEEVVEGQGFAELILLDGFARHAAEHVVLFEEVLLPGVFVGERGEDLGGDRILIVRGQGTDFFQRLLEQRRHISILLSGDHGCRRDPSKYGYGTMVESMKSVYALILVIGALSRARLAFAEDIVVRLVDVRSGGGEKGCSVALLGSTSDRPAPLRWLTQRADTKADGRTRFSIAGPLPSFVQADVGLIDCLQCAPLPAASTDEILRASVMGGMDGKNNRGELYCHPDLKKLEETTAKPGEILIFVRKLSFWEKIALF